MEKVIYLYRRSRCDLCNDALINLQILQPKFQFSIKEVDIDEDPDLIEKYDLLIPVIVMDGHMLQYGQIDLIQLEKDLQSLYKTFTK